MEVALLIILWGECFQCSYSLFPQVHFGSEAHSETVNLTLMACSSFRRLFKKIKYSAWALLSDLILIIQAWVMGIGFLFFVVFFFFFE